MNCSGSGRWLGGLLLLLVVTLSGSAISAPLPMNLVVHIEITAGAMSSLRWKACDPPLTAPPCASTNAWAVSHNVTGSTANWTWDSDTGTLASSGLYWPASYIRLSPNGATVISDRVEDLAIDTLNQVTTASAYACVEGTFLASVGANGCKDINIGANFADNTTTAWNAGNVRCVTEVIGGDDFSLLDGSAGVPGTPNPRGLTAQTAGQAGVGCARTSGAFDFWNVIVNDGTYLVLADVPSSLFPACYLYGTLLTGGCPLDEAHANVSYLLFAAPGAPDTDGDGNVDGFDNCPAIANPGQSDVSGDGIGDVCDPDLDGDGLVNGVDNCPGNANPGQSDADSDGVGDICDNCRLVANTTAGTVPNSPGIPKAQLDSDADGYGNACDTDVNNSGSTTASDYSVLRSVIGRAYNFSANAARSDLNGSGTVTAADYAILRARIGTAPGPSGYACAGTIPCPP